MPHELAHQVNVAGLKPGPDAESMPEIVELVPFQSNLPCDLPKLVGIVLGVVPRFHELPVNPDQVMVERDLPFLVPIGIFGLHETSGLSVRLISRALNVPPSTVADYI